MTTITDESMRERLNALKPYTVVLLRTAAGYGEPGADKIIWEHGRRQFSLRSDGVLSIICPVADDTELAGVNIFNASAEETTRLMEADPAVIAGVLRYELHPINSFPGDCLPA